MSEHLNRLHEQRTRAVTAAQAIVDLAHTERRAVLSGEEEAGYQRATAEVRDLDEQIRTTAAEEQRSREADVARQAMAWAITPRDDTGPFSARPADAFERWIRGDKSASNTRDGRDAYTVDLSGAARAHALARSGAEGAELRAMLTDGGASGGSLTVPTTVASEIYGYMESSSAMRRISRVIQTSGGEAMKFPKVGTHAIGTQVIAQGTAIGGTDPVLDTMTLDAFKYGELVQVSTEMIQDVTFDVLSFIAQDAGRAVGRYTDTHYCTGTGSGQPNGVVTAATGSVVTGGSLITASFESLINLQHSIADEYLPNTSWVTAYSTAGTLRKIREDAGGTTGAFIWQPSLIAGQPDTLLGRPVYYDGNIAAQGSAAKSAVYGDFQSYYIRDAGPVRFERSDDFAFDKDLVTFRVVARTDADLVDTAAIKVHRQSVT